MMAIDLFLTCKVMMLRLRTPRQNENSDNSITNINSDVIYTLFIQTSLLVKATILI